MCCMPTTHRLRVVVVKLVDGWQWFMLCCVVSCRVPMTRWEYNFKSPLRLAFEVREGGWVVV